MPVSEKNPTLQDARRLTSFALSYSAFTGEVSLAEVPVDKATWSLGSDSVAEGSGGNRFDFSPSATKKRLVPTSKSPSPQHASASASATPPSSSSPAALTAPSVTTTVPSSSGHSRPRLPGGSGGPSVDQQDDSTTTSSSGTSAGSGGVLRRQRDSPHLGRRNPQRLLSQESISEEGPVVGRFCSRPYWAANTTSNSSVDSDRRRSSTETSRSIWSVRSR